MVQTKEDCENVVVMGKGAEKKYFQAEGAVKFDPNVCWKLCRLWSYLLIHTHGSDIAIPWDSYLKYAQTEFMLIKQGRDDRISFGIQLPIYISSFIRQLWKSALKYLVVDWHNNDKQHVFQKKAISCMEWQNAKKYSSYRTLTGKISWQFSW